MTLSREQVEDLRRRLIGAEVGEAADFIYNNAEIGELCDLALRALHPAPSKERADLVRRLREGCPLIPEEESPDEDIFDYEASCALMREAADALESGARDGWVSVPKEPSEEMLIAMMESDGTHCEPSDDVYEEGALVENGMSKSDCDHINQETMDGYRRSYKAMLSAAPQAGK